MNAPLIGDPRRAASDSIGGYVYQLWHSVYAWLNLKDDEWLYLEGAEDMDVHGKTTVETTQVKREEASLSLNTARAREVLNNFWKVQNDNRDREIFYRLVTTAGIAQESTVSFGKRKGIEIWNSPHKTQEELDSLKAFLGGQALSPELSAFIEGASVNELDDKLFRRLRWDTSEPRAEGVIAAIERKLVVLGERYRISPLESKNVSAHLLSAVAAAASSKDPAVKSLERAGLLELFQEKTQTVISNADARHYQDLLRGAAGTPVSPSGLSIQTAQASSVSRRAPPGLAKTYPRTTLMGEITAAMSEMAVVVLHGSTGRGKTRLAAMAAVGKNVLWADLGIFGYDEGKNAGPGSRATLEELARAVDSDSGINLIVIDDLDFSPEVFRIYKSALEALIYTLHDTTIQLLITSQKSQPATLAALCGEATCQAFPVPDLSEEEVASFLRMYGCPLELVDLWTPIVLGTTLGHPQLVHARSIALNGLGWPVPTHEDLVTSPPEVDETKRNAALLLSQTQATELSLVYPLSLFQGRFRRDHALKVGEELSKLPNAGDTFDKLLGPWIESVGDNYFQLSPLLGSAASSAWSSDKIKGTREQIGQIVLDCNQLDIADASNVLFQAVFSSSNLLLLQLIPGIMELPREGQAQFAQRSAWMAFVHVEKLTDLDATVRKLLLTLQLVVALEVRPKGVIAILDQIGTVCGPEVEERLVLIWSQLRVFMGARELEPDRAAELLIAVLEAHAEKWEDGQVQELFKFSNLREELAELGFDYPRALLSFLISRCSDKAFLSGLVAELATNLKLQAIFRDAFAKSPGLAALMVNYAWLAEEKLAEPDWPPVLALLGQISSVGVRIPLQTLQEAAVRAVVVIQDEYLKDRPAAAETIASALVAIQTPSPLLLDGQATFLFNGKQWRDALSIWERILPGLAFEPIAGETIGLWGRRKAAMAASQLGLWIKAAGLYEDASKLVVQDTISQQALAVGLLADAGYAMWKSGDRARALTRFTAVLLALEALPNTKEELQAFKVQKCFGQMLLNICKHAGQTLNDMVYETPIGFCSNPETPEQFKELMLAPTEYLWVVLLELIDPSDDCPELKRLAAERLSVTLYPFNRQRFLQFEVEGLLHHALRDKAHFPVLCQDYVTAFTVSHAQIIPTQLGVLTPVPLHSFVPSPANTDPTIVFYCFEAAVTALVVQGDSVIETVDQWELASAALPLSQSLRIWAAGVKTVFAMDEPDLVNMVKTNGTRHLRFLAALKLCQNPSNLSLDELVTAQLLVCERLKGNPFRIVMADMVLVPITAEWTSRLPHRMQFRLPNLSIPAVRDACALNAPGLQKLASVILASLTAVWIGIPSEFEKTLKEFAGNPDVI